MTDLYKPRPDRLIRFRFGLRTMFVASTLLGLWMAHVVQTAHRQRVLVEAVESAGGYVAWNYQCDQVGNWRRDRPQPFPEWITNVTPKEYLYRIQYFGVSPKQRHRTIMLQQLADRLPWKPKAIEWGEPARLRPTLGSKFVVPFTYENP